MTPAEIKHEVYMHYRDESGQVTIDHDPGINTTGNGPMHTGIFYTYLYENEIFDTEDDDALDAYVDRITVRDKDGNKISGLIHRSLWKTGELEGPDDYWTMLAVGYHNKNGFPEAHLAYGEANNWVINNLNPGVPTPNAWFDRMPGYVVFVRMCARKTLSIYDKLFLASLLIKSAYDPASDAYYQNYCKLTVARKASPLIFWPVSFFWFWKQKRNGEYFKTNPLSQAVLK